MNTKQLPRPTRRGAISELAATVPIPFEVTCAGRELPWPTGKNVPTLAEVLHRDIQTQDTNHAAETVNA